MTFANYGRGVLKQLLALAVIAGICAIAVAFNMYGHHRPPVMLVNEVAGIVAFLVGSVAVVIGVRFIQEGRRGGFEELRRDSTRKSSTHHG